jgi:hypothetical protein
MKTKLSTMFTIVLNYLIIVILITAIVLPGSVGRIVIAEGKVTSSESFAGPSVVIMDGEAYLTSDSAFRLNYQIKNETGSNISQIKVEETLYDQNDGVASGTETVIWESIIEAGRDKTFNGREFKSKKGVSAYTLGYKIEYLPEGSDQWVFVKEGKKQITPLYTGVEVIYRASTGGPIPTGGEVTYTFEIQSSANINIENIRVSDSVLGDIGVIPVLVPDAAASVSQTFKLNKTTKSYPIIVFDDPTGIQGEIKREFKNAAVEVTVEEPPQVENPLVISGKTNKSKIVPNEEVDFSLSLQNKGNRRLTNVRLVNWEGKEVLSRDALDPGKEGTVIYTARVEPGKDYIFKASAIEEETGRNVQASYSVKFTGIEAELQITNRVTPEDIAVGDIVNIEYTLRNTGKVTMVDILVQEPEFGQVGSFDELKPGEEKTFSIERIIEEDTISHPRVFAKDQVTGYDYEFEGELIEITINTIEALPLLTIRLTSEPEVLTEAGTVDLVCTVINEGDIRIDNIELILNERELNIGSILTLEPGDQETLTLPGLNIEENTTFTVKAKGITYDGDEVEFLSEPYEIQIGVDMPEEPKENPKLSFLKKLLGVVIALALATAGGIVYLIYDLRRGDKKKAGGSARIRKKNTRHKS